MKKVDRTKKEKKLWKRSFAQFSFYSLFQNKTSMHVLWFYICRIDRTVKLHQAYQTIMIKKVKFWLTTVLFWKEKWTKKKVDRSKHCICVAMNPLKYQKKKIVIKYVFHIKATSFLQHFMFLAFVRSQRTKNNIYILKMHTKEKSATGTKCNKQKVHDNNNLF